MALESAKKNQRWDRRKTSGPKNIIVYPSYPGLLDMTPEEVLAAWWSDRLRLPDHTMRPLRRCRDLVITVRAYDGRSKTGKVELLTIDLRGKSF